MELSQCHLEDIGPMDKMLELEASNANTKNSIYRDITVVFHLEMVYVLLVIVFTEVSFTDEMN
jgi:hypothetical protein